MIFPHGAIISLVNIIRKNNKIEYEQQVDRTCCSSTKEKMFAESSCKHSIMCIEFSESYGKSSIDMVCLFDSNDLTEEAADKLIRDGIYNDIRFVVMEKEQYETVFRSLKNNNL